MIKTDQKTGLKYRENTMDLYVIREQSSYRELLKRCQGKTVLDIGANIGAFAYQALQHGASEVYCFEPDKDNIEMFKKQELHPVRLFDKAVTAQGGDVTLYHQNGKNKGTHSVVPTRGRSESTVKSVALEKVLKKFDPDIIKIDIEGGEYDFDLSLIQCEAIAIELHLTKKGMREKGEETLAYLKENYIEKSNTKFGGKHWTKTFIGVRADAE